jgi:hypothetical protein
MKKPKNQGTIEKTKAIKNELIKSYFLLLQFSLVCFLCV